MFEAIPPTVFSGGVVGVAFTIVMTILGLVIRGHLIPESRHKEVIDLYKAEADRLTATIAKRDDQISALIDANKTTVAAWEVIRREAERPN